MKIVNFLLTDNDLDIFLERSITLPKNNLVSFLEKKVIQAEDGELNIVTNIYFLFKFLEKKIPWNNQTDVQLITIISILKKLYSKFYSCRFKLTVLFGKGKVVHSLKEIILFFQNLAKESPKEREALFRDVFTIQRYVKDYESLTSYSLKLDKGKTIMLSSGQHWKFAIV